MTEIVWGLFLSEKSAYSSISSQKKPHSAGASSIFTWKCFCSVEICPPGDTKSSPNWSLWGGPRLHAAGRALAPSPPAGREHQHRERKFSERAGENPGVLQPPGAGGGVIFLPSTFSRTLTLSPASPGRLRLYCHLNEHFRKDTRAHKWTETPGAFTDQRQSLARKVESCEKLQLQSCRSPNRPSPAPHHPGQVRSRQEVGKLSQAAQVFSPCPLLALPDTRLAAGARVSTEHNPISPTDCYRGTWQGRVIQFPISCVLLRRG